jgi:hypothetical protein
MFKSFTNFFSRETPSSPAELAPTHTASSTNLTTTKPTPNTTNTNTKESDLFQSSFASSAGPYSLRSLPPRTQALLTAQPDFQRLLGNNNNNNNSRDG